MTHKKKYIWAYLDGKPLVELVQTSLDNNMTVAELKKKLIAENKGHEITFKLK